MVAVSVVRYAVRICDNEKLSQAPIHRLHLAAHMSMIKAVTLIDPVHIFHDPLPVQPAEPLPQVYANDLRQHFACVEHKPFM